MLRDTCELAQISAVRVFSSSEHLPFCQQEQRFHCFVGRSSQSLASSTNGAVVSGSAEN